MTAEDGATAGEDGRPATPPAQTRPPGASSASIALDPSASRATPTRSPTRSSSTSSGSSDADVEVQARDHRDVPDGVPDDVVRTVTENAKTLKFEQHGFEEA